MVEKPEIHRAAGVAQHLGTKKITELDEEELEAYGVSEHSRFGDVSWWFINPVPGSKKSDSVLNWGMILLDGSCLTDAQHVARLRWAKILALTLLALPAAGRAPAPGSMSGIQVEFK